MIFVSGSICRKGHSLLWQAPIEKVTKKGNYDPYRARRKYWPKYANSFYHELFISNDALIDLTFTDYKRINHGGNLFISKDS